MKSNLYLASEKRIRSMAAWLWPALVLFSLNTSGQRQTIDSLKNVLYRHSVNDSQKVDLLAEIAITYQFIDPDTMITFAKQGLEISNKLGYERGKGDCIKQLGIAYYVKSDFKKALEFDRHALRIYQRLHYQKGIGAILNNMAVVHTSLANYEKSLTMYQLSLAVREQIGDEKGIGASLNNIGNTYNEIGNYPEALMYLLRGLKVREKLNDHTGIANSMSNIAKIYFAVGKYANALEYSLKALSLHEKMGNKEGIVNSAVTTGGVYSTLLDFPKATHYFTRALQQSMEVGNKSENAICLSNLGEVYLKQKQYNKALENYTEALQVSVETDDREGMAINQNGIGVVYLQNGRIAESIEYFRRSYQISKDIGAKLRIMESAQNLAMAYDSLKDYRNAYNFHNIYSSFKDSVFNEVTQKKVDQIQFDYALDKKQQEISLLEKDKALQARVTEKQKLTLIALAIGVLLSMLVMFILYRTGQKEKHIRKLISGQKEEIQAQAKKLEMLNDLKDKTFSILSHDLRSPVASLMSVMTLLEDKMITPDEFIKIEKDLNKQLSSLSMLLDNLLFWSKNYMLGDNMSRKDELNLTEMVDKVFALLQHAADQKHIVLINHIKENVLATGNQEQIEIVLRNLVSNAIKFTKDHGQISVSSRHEDGMVTVFVADTGIGISEEDLGKLFINNSHYSSHGTEGEKGTGLGLLICKEFIEKNGGTLGVKSEVASGSTFYFTLLRMIS